jgi:hydrogenase nickel incorporation protein HypA/HybF
MHEISLCESILDIINERAAQDRFSKVKRVRLEVGPFSSVEPEALRFGFDVVMRGSVAEGAKLEIGVLPGLFSNRSGAAPAGCLLQLRCERLADEKR